MTTNAASFIELGSPTGFNNVGQVPSWKALSSLVPPKAGTVVLVQSYIENNGYGGGQFIARAGNRADDGGTICKVNNSWYWERVIADHSKLTILDFGAVRDGVTDCVAACKAMLNWSQSGHSAYNGIGIQFPAGPFAISNLDLSAKYVSLLRISGPQCLFGYFPATTLYLIGEDDAPAILSDARKVEISGFIINGQTDKAPNTRGFFKNIRKEGQFIHGSYWRAERVGGVLWDIVDTLDTRFEEWYTSHCSGTLFRNRWSDSKTGSWYHTTAVELSNFNIQYQEGPNPALDMPRCTQSVIRNGWIEHCQNPGTLNNGQWLIDALSIEGCAQPLDLSYCMVTESGTSLQSGSTIVYNDPAIKEYAPFERGRSQQNAHGVRYYGSLAYNYLHSNIRFRNMSDKPLWVKVGDWAVFDENDITTFRVVGGNGEALDTGLASIPGSNGFGGGELEMTLRRIPGIGTRQDGSVKVTGTSPLMDIAVERPWERNVTVYIQLPPNCGWVNCYLETTSHSRFTNGTPFVWNYAGEEVSDEDMGTKKVFRPRNTMAMGTLTHGLGFMEDGSLTLKTRPITADGKLPVNINGVFYGITVEKYPVASDNFGRSAPLSGRVLDNGLGGLQDLKWGNWGVMGGVSSEWGVAYFKQKTAAVLGLNTTANDYEVRFDVVTAPVTVKDDSSMTFEFRRSNWNNMQTGYRVAFMGKDAAGMSSLQLHKRLNVNGSQSTVRIDTVDMRIKDGQKLRVVVRGTRIQVFADESMLCDVVDGDIAVGPYVAFGMNDGNTGLTIAKFEVLQA